MTDVTRQNPKILQDNIANLGKTKSQKLSIVTLLEMVPKGKRLLPKRIILLGLPNLSKLFRAVSLE